MYVGKCGCMLRDRKSVGGGAVFFYAMEIKGITASWNTWQLDSCTSFKTYSCPCSYALVLSMLHSVLYKLTGSQKFQTYGCQIVSFLK